VKLVLDTHIFLWTVFDDRKLGKRTREVLDATSSELWLSPVSLWEAMILDRDGKLELLPNPLRWARDTLAAFPFREAPLIHEVALRSREIQLPHADAADRFLAATAAVYDLTLVTSDERLLAGSGYAVIANE